MRHRSLLPPINTEKHYFHSPIFTVANGSVTTIVIADAVSVQAKDQPNEVEEGSLIKTVHLEYWISSNLADTAGSAIVTVEKIPSDGDNPTFTQINNLGSYTNKKNVLFTFEGITPALNLANPIPVLRQWVAIPKGKQRMGLRDKKAVHFASITSGFSVCGVALYKEWK